MESVTLALITQVCSKFYTNPSKSYSTKDFKTIDNYNYGSVKVQLKRLVKYGIIKQLLNKRYQLRDQKKALALMNKKGNTFRSPSLTPPHRIRAKTHNLSIGSIDMSGEPLEWLIKLNMLTKPKPGDRAKNVGLRPGQAKHFNMRLSLKTGKAYIYPKSQGWDAELQNMFYWSRDFINRMKGAKENPEIAINYEDLQRSNPYLANIPFEDVKGLLIEHKGMRLQLCASQFKEGEICILSDSIEETASLTEKIVYGQKDLAPALRETAFEKTINNRLGGIEKVLGELPFSLATLISGAVQQGIEAGFKNAFENQPGPKPGDDINIR